MNEVDTNSIMFEERISIKIANGISEEDAFWETMTEAQNDARYPRKEIS